MFCSEKANEQVNLVVEKGVGEWALALKNSRKVLTKGVKITLKLQSQKKQKNCE